MTKTLLRPPDTTQSFTLYGGCGKPHEYDGVHGIDCARCVELVRLMSPEERIQHPHLRGPVVVAGDTPAEMDALRREAQAKRLAASFRLEEVEEAEATPEDRESEVARLKARLAELEGESTLRRRSTARA